MPASKSARGAELASGVRAGLAGEVDHRHGERLARADFGQRLHGRGERHAGSVSRCCAVPQSVATNVDCLPVPVPVRPDSGGQPNPSAVAPGPPTLGSATTAT